MREDLAAFPQAVRASLTQPARTYTRVTDLLAVQGAIPDSLRPLVTRELAPGIGLIPADRAPQLPQTARITPVYALGPAGSPMVPTGRVLVRFGEGERAESQGGAIERAGYRLVAALPYAPQAAWVESPAGPARGLSELARLEAIPGVVSVEPEMVGGRAAR
ncbi:MAG: hypothetical protein ACJ8DC_05410 [Gemmatimonadales bacterium]